MGACASKQEAVVSVSACTRARGDGAGLWCRRGAPIAARRRLTAACLPLSPLFARLSPQASFAPEHISKPPASDAGTDIKSSKLAESVVSSLNEPVRTESRLAGSHAFPRWYPCPAPPALPLILPSPLSARPAPPLRRS